MYAGCWTVRRNVELYMTKVRIIMMARSARMKETA